MNVAMFIVGFCIFVVYVGFLIWNIFYNHNKNREENYPGYYSRHGQVDNMDSDGMGNFSRFPNKKQKNVPKRRNVSRRRSVRTKN